MTICCMAYLGLFDCAAELKSSLEVASKRRGLLDATADRRCLVVPDSIPDATRCSTESGIGSTQPSEGN
jgi:hypothetical protein